MPYLHQINRKFCQEHRVSVQEIMIQGTRYWMLGSECWMLDTGRWIMVIQTHAKVGISSEFSKDVARFGLLVIGGIFEQ